MGRLESMTLTLISIGASLQSMKCRLLPNGLSDSARGFLHGGDDALNLESALLEILAERGSGIHEGVARSNADLVQSLKAAVVLNRQCSRVNELCRGIVNASTDEVPEGG